ncbi:hypothetical protein Q5752_004523 [Cryptotrichosporon argae]
MFPALPTLSRHGSAMSDTRDDDHCERKMGVGEKISNRLHMVFHRGEREPAPKSPTTTPMSPTSPGAPLLHTTQPRSPTATYTQPPPDGPGIFPPLGEPGFGADKTANPPASAHMAGIGAYRYIAPDEIVGRSSGVADDLQTGYTGQGPDRAGLRPVRRST